MVIDSEEALLCWRMCWMGSAYGFHREEFTDGNVLLRRGETEDLDEAKDGGAWCLP